MRLILLLLMFPWIVCGIEFELPPLCSIKNEVHHEDPALFVPDQLAALTSDANQLIGGLVSPLSGSPCLGHTDFVVQGANPLALTRIYVAPFIPHRFAKAEDKDWYYRREYLKQHYEGWRFFPHQRLWYDAAKQEVHLITPNGATYDFQIDTKTTLVHSYAATNVGDGETPNGKYDPRNTRIIHENSTFSIIAPDGSKRFYRLKNERYLLEKEILLNGKVLKYHYKEGELNRVESLDPQERYVYASVTIGGSPKEGKYSFMGSTGLEATYHYIQYSYKGKFHTGNSPYKYNGITPPLMTKASSTFYEGEKSSYIDPHYLLESFSSKKSLCRFHYSVFGTHYRVDKLLLPVGSGDAFEGVYTMSYDPAVAGEKGGTTKVKNDDGTTTVYHFSPQLLTTSINYLGPDGLLKREKVYTWSDKNWLTCVEVRDDKKTVLLRKSYTYDAFGNPITETLSGDLQGEGREDFYTIKRL